MTHPGNIRPEIQAVTLMCAIGICVFAVPSTVHSQDTKATPAPKETPAKSDTESESPKPDEPKPSEENETKPDPFAVPDGKPEDLVIFINKVTRTPPSARTLAERKAEFRKRLEAVITATDKILEQKPEEKIEIFALTNRFNALNSLATQFDPSKAEQLTAMIEQLEKETRPVLARLPAFARLREHVTAAVRKPTENGMQEVAEQVVAYWEKYGVDRDSYSAAVTIGRGFEMAGSSESGAKLFEQLAELMKASEDPELAARAERTLGTARKLRLPGHTMEVTGQTADGKPFDWTAYRGKVVLVDFWASWCGPCLAELPNMKRCLELYGDKGFAIVGINMDSSMEAFEKCVTDREISWVNVMGEMPDKLSWNHPLAVYYGIDGIPAAILVDKEGKVVSLRARGSELLRRLEELLGPAEEPAADTKSDPAKPAEPVK